MKKKLFFAGMSVCALTFVLMMFAGCDTDDDDDKVDIPTANVQVYDGDGKPYAGNGTVKLSFWDSATGASLGSLDAGTITSGKLTLKLPSNIADKYLSDATSGIPDGITVTPSDVKVGAGELIVFAGEDEIVGSIAYTNNSSDAISYMYVTKAATVTGTYNDVDDGEEYTMTYNASLGAGWNPIWRHVSGNNAAVKTNLAGLPSNLKWVLELGEGD